MACFGLINMLILGDSTIDIHLHDTYFVIAHFHIAIAVAFCLLIISGLYYVVPRLSGRRVYYSLGVFHFICTAGGAIVIFWPMHYEGVVGGPRRYYDYSAWESFRQFISINPTISTVSALLFLAQIVFVVNLLVSAFAGKRM